MSLFELIEGGFGDKEREDYSCSETILYGANRIYNLKLEPESMKMAAGLSSGVYSGQICGALSGGALVLAKLYVKERAHEGEYASGLVEELIGRFEEAMKTVVCTDLKECYKTDEEGCRPIILQAARILDEIICREGF